MNKKTQITIVILLTVASFLGGTTFAKLKYGSDEKINSKNNGAEPTKVANQSTPPVFVPKTKSAQPEVKFFVMSFCPYGNQAEAGLEPVYQLLKDKVVWVPRYIISDKKSSCEQGCPFRVYNDSAKTRCDDAVKQGQVKDLETCRSYFPYSSADECLKKECAGLKAGEFESLHGSQELNQDIREIAAYNLAVESGTKVLGAQSGDGALGKWWKFVTLVNDKCNAQNADTCWKEQALTAGFDSNKISQTEKTQTTVLAQKEIAEGEKYQASGSPTILINDTLYNGGRSPEDYKKAICSAFENPPEECGKILGQETNTTTGDCN